MYPKTFYGRNYKKLEHLSLSVTSPSPISTLL